ncbi:hypothetical protein OROHE_008818 [Orobanche hederae]
MKKRVAHILVFKIRPSQEINIILDGTPLEAEEILTYIMYYRRKEWHGFYFSKFGHLKKFSKFVMVPLGGGRNFDIQKKALEMDRKLDARSKVLQKKRVARILVFKIRPSQKIHKIRDVTPLEAEEILTYIKSPRNGSVWRFSRNLDVPSNVLQKKRVARILVFKIRPSQEILKIRDEINIILDGTPLEAEEILTYRKSLETDRFGTFLASYMSLVMYYRRKEWHGFYFSKFGHLKKFSKFVMVPLGGGRNFNIQKKALEMDRVARILVFKIRPSQEILKIRDGTPLE